MPLVARGTTRHERCYCRRPATVEPGIQGARVEFLQGKDALTNYHGQSPTQFPYPSIVEDCRRREVWSVGQAFPVWPNLFLVFPPHRMRRVGSCLPTYLGRARSSKLSFGVRSKVWWAKNCRNHDGQAALHVLVATREHDIGIQPSAIPSRQGWGWLDQVQHVAYPK